MSFTLDTPGAIRLAVALGACVFTLAASEARCDETPCKPTDGAAQQAVEALTQGATCPNVGTDPDKTPFTNYHRWMRLDPTGVGSTAEVVMWGGMTTDGDANHGIKLYMSDSVRADQTFYRQAMAFYTRLEQADESYTHEVGLVDHAPIESPATGRFDAWTEAKSAAGGDSYRAMKIMALYGHDNQSNEMKEPGAALTGCYDRIDQLDRHTPGMSSLLYRDNAIAGRWYDHEKDVEAGKKVAANCEAAKNNADCLDLSYRCNDSHSSYQADYYQVILAAFAGCRAKRYSSNTGTYGLKLAAEQSIVKKYKHERFVEELDEVAANPKAPEQARTMPELRRVLSYAYSNEDCALPSDMRFEGACAAVAKATAERQAFEMCFRVRQHTLGYDFGYNVAGCN